MQKSTLLSVLIATATVAAAEMAHAVVPPVDGAGRPAFSVCPAGTTPKSIYHFDKVIFQISAGNLVPINAADAAALNALPRTTDLDIKIIDHPRTVADLESKVLSFLGAQPANPGNRQLLRITDVEYTTIVCP
ncbi:MAG: hypothetical protein L0Y57_10045 [Beijerinckiaceae bacterium]|nr:hypothetical protein [Beijerinckiaceae bacterium]